MAEKQEPPGRGIESRFRDLSVDVRHERLIRYVVKQVENGRHVKDILSDPYVLEHSDEVARSRIPEDPHVLQAVEEQIRRQFADYGGSVAGTDADGGDDSQSEGEDDARLPDM